MKYTQCERHASFRDEDVSITEFVEWLAAKGIRLCKQIEDEWSGVWVPVGGDKELDAFLAEYHGIDLKLLERERRHILEGQRISNENS